MHGLSIWNPFKKKSWMSSHGLFTHHCADFQARLEIPRKKRKTRWDCSAEPLKNQPNLRKPSLTGKKKHKIWRGEIYGFRFRGKPCKSVKCVRYWMGNSSYSANVNSCDGTTKNAEVSHGVTICKYWGTWAGKMLDKWRISRWLIGLASVHPKGIIWNYQLKKIGATPRRNFWVFPMGMVWILVADLKQQPWNNSPCRYSKWGVSSSSWGYPIARWRGFGIGKIPSFEIFGWWWLGG